MNEQNKAFCGDAIAQLAVGELLRDCTKLQGVLTNKAMTFAWFNFQKKEIDKIDNPNLLVGYYKQHGTKFEAMLYDVYLDEGYEAAKQIVKNYLLPLRGSKELSYI